jgi:hypothetical protein
MTILQLPFLHYNLGKRLADWQGNRATETGDFAADFLQKQQRGKS